MLGYARAVAGIHPWLGGAAIVVCATAAFVGGFLYWRGRGAGPITTHLLSLAQTLLVAQVGVGLLLLADDRRAPEQLHYLYGTLALAVALAPWFVRAGVGATPPALVRRDHGRRGRARDPRVHDGHVVRNLYENRFLRGIALVALVSLVIVLLSLENSLATASALLSIAFFLAIAFFLFLLWRERRSDIEAWSRPLPADVLRRDRARRPRGRRAARPVAARGGRDRLRRSYRVLRVGARPRLAARASVRLRRRRAEAPLPRVAASRRLVPWAGVSVRTGRGNALLDEFATPTLHPLVPGVPVALGERTAEMKLRIVLLATAAALVAVALSLNLASAGRLAPSARNTQRSGVPGAEGAERRRPQEGVRRPVDHVHRRLRRRRVTIATSRSRSSSRRTPGSR